MEIHEKLGLIRSKLPQGVDLIAVSKFHSNEAILEAYQAGHRDFGENRVQELAEKQESLPNDIRWHMIGHVQTNKIKYFAPFVHLVHGVDREKVLKEINKEAKKAGRVINCLLQIHIAKEDSKFGLDASEAHDLCAKITNGDYPHIALKGLMGMATFTEDNEQIRSEFAGLKSLFEELKSKYQTLSFDILSMGMSSDYGIAIEKGSNMIRVGSAIFGQRN